MPCKEVVALPEWSLLAMKKEVFMWVGDSWHEPLELMVVAPC